MIDDFNSNLGRYGYVYIPNQCFTQVSCKAHMYLHGCFSAVNSYYKDFQTNNDRWG